MREGKRGAERAERENVYRSRTTKSIRIPVKKNFGKGKTVDTA